MNDITKIKVDGEFESTYKLFPKNREFEKRAGGNTGSQSGVQSDWNQNNDTQPDYVKNRPFYTDAVETILVEESTVPFNEGGNGLYGAQVRSTFVPTVGEAYKVSWDGTVYECTCVEFNGNIVIGNLSIGGSDSDTGEPFIMVVSEPRINIITVDTSDSHTVSISGFVQEVVKIDRKYLPKTAIITYDSNTDTYSSDLTYDELYEIMLDGRQVVFHASSNEYQYLTKWKKQASGRIDLALAGGNYGVSLYTDGTIGKTPIS